VVGAAVFAQLVGMPRFTYPFVDWTMYSQVHPANTFIRYDTVRASGAEEHLPISRLTPSTSPRAVMAGLNGLVHSTDVKDGERLRRALSALAAIENRRAPADPIEQVVISRCSIQVGAGASGEARCNRLRTVEVR
jgi:hypothetical protein